MAHVAAWKKEEVEMLSALLQSYPVIGIVDISGIAAKQLQSMRREFHGNVQIRIARNTLLRFALQESDDEALRSLASYVQGGASLALSTLNPFVLYKKFEKGKTSAPAKGGEVAPNDVMIPKGDTGFPPGPLVGEMQRIGIPAAIESGKIVVKKDHVVVKEGEVIKPEVAEILKKLEIEPLEVGLNLFAAYENGFVFEARDLAIDESAVRDQFEDAYRSAFNLAINAAITTNDTTSMLVTIAFNNMRNLSFNAGIVNEESLPLLIAKSQAEMLSLARHVGEDALDEELVARLGATAAAPA
ncbi:MAG TPA: 50S ribosomal protein L10, partial [Methanomicrobia archaeon]|nr:50S ribosomal protein L10 [Methanomicrobia archaeon]